MRKGVIKKVVMAASLGLALFFSGQALAGNDQVLFIWKKDASDGNYYVHVVATSKAIDLPKGWERGADLRETNTLYIGCKPYKFTDTKPNPRLKQILDDAKITGQTIREIYVDCDFSKIGNEPKY